MSTAEEATTHFDPLTDDSALAMFANRRDGLNRTLETVERVPRSGRNQFESLVIFVPANFAFRHWAPHSQANRAELV